MAQREVEHARERGLGHREFIVRHRQAALGDVEHALRSATVAGRIVQHAVVEAKALQERRVHRVAVGGQREFASEPGLIQNKRARGQARCRADVGQVGVEEMLHAFVHRRELMAQAAGDLPLLREERRGHVVEISVVTTGNRGTAEEAQTEIDGEAALFGREGGVRHN